MPTHRSLCFLSFALIACPGSSTTPTGRVTASFGSDGEVEGTDRDSGSAPDELVVSGTVASLGAPSGDETWLIDDYGEVAKVLGLTDINEQVYWAGWAASEADGTDLSPTPSLALDTSVTLTFYADSGWGGPFTGLTVTDAIGLVLAVEAGGLGDGEFAELTVSAGEETSTVQGECGREVSHEVVFQGEGGPVAVAPGREGDVQVDGRSLKVRVIESYQLLDSNCTDISGGIGWVAWLP
ncbi:MAG: hypothetical protein ABIO70_04050 [Pseudomonadota bacterium]